LNESFQDYINRVAQLTLPTTYTNKLENIRKSPKFESGEPVPFPGYTITTPIAADDIHNQLFYQQLNSLQDKLQQEVESQTIVFLPPDSLHFTLADLVWENNYRAALEKNTDFEIQLQSKIAEIFANFAAENIIEEPIYWQFFGSIVKPRTIAALLVPKDEASYEKIVQLRCYIYQNSGLIGLGIEQQYDFTAHVTLGYFNDIPDNFDRVKMQKILLELNEKWLETESPTIEVCRGELRKFDNMTDYYREENYPAIEFGRK
jgi:hypothetical protein